MGITAGKRGHINICASAVTVSLPICNREEKSKRELSLSLVLSVLNWSKTYVLPLSHLVFTNSGKQLILKFIQFSTISRGKSSQITSVKLLWYALHFSCFNVKKNSNIQVQGGEEEKDFEAQLSVAGVRQRIEEITQNCKGIWGLPDTKIQELVGHNLEAEKFSVLQGVWIFTNWECKWFSSVQSLV